MLVFLAERLPGIPHRQCSQSQRHQRTGPVKETSVILQKLVKERFEEKLEGEIEVAYVSSLDRPTPVYASSLLRGAYSSSLGFRRALMVVVGT